MQIKYLNGEKKGTSVKLTPPGVCLGRENDNDIQLLVAGVSRYHAKITFNGTAWSIADIGSTNGTKVNGNLISAETVVHHGDIVSLGDQELGIDNPEESKPLFSAPFETKTPEPIPTPAPAPKETPAPTPEPVATDPASPKDLLDKLKKNQLSGNIFGNKNEESSESTVPKTEEELRQQKKAKLSNLVFCVLVVAIAVIGIAAFLKINAPEKAKEIKTGGSNASKADDILLVYQKTKITPDNIFRFTLRIENDSAEFVLDDLKYSRHFLKTFKPVKGSLVKKLVDSIQETDFMKLSQTEYNSSGGNALDDRTILFASKGKMNRITVRNTYAPNSFEAVENAIDYFAGDYGIRTVSLSVAEMRSEAMKAFTKAESLFDNYQAKPSNLRDAIVRYHMAMDYLDQFEPKPREWDIARKRLIDAKALFNAQLKDYNFNILQYSKLKQYDRAASECQKVMDMTDPDEPAFKSARDWKIKFDKMKRK